MVTGTEIFLADESVDFRVVSDLRREGYEVANRLKAILITEDKDFGELTYRLQRPNQGIVLIRMGGLSLEERLPRIKAVLAGHLSDLRNRFSVVTQDKLR